MKPSNRYMPFKGAIHHRLEFCFIFLFGRCNQGRINNYIYRYRLTKDEIASCGNDLDKYKQLAKEKRSSI